MNSRSPEGHSLSERKDEQEEEEEEEEEGEEGAEREAEESSENMSNVRQLVRRLQATEVVEFTTDHHPFEGWSSRRFRVLWCIVVGATTIISYTPLS